MSICYEAGPTGFVLARRLIKLNFDCHVVVPTAIPKSGDRIKTDRRDAMKMARYFRSGDLKFVHIPSGLKENQMVVVTGAFHVKMATISTDLPDTHSH